MLTTALDGHAMVSITCVPDHTTAYSESPQPIKALQGIKIKQIACGDSHCLAVTMKGEVQRCQVVGDTLWHTHLMEVFMAGDGISNYVDHHVSAREQITLQDTMEGMVYSASQFGLDEIFGDGDASQIGLDLDGGRPFECQLLLH